MKRVVAMGDLHCGHVAGLTPPSWHYRRDSDNAYQKNFAVMQSTEWKWYDDTVKALQPVDVLIVNGDAIDGKGEASGGTELITTDRKEQVSMARECIEAVGAKAVYIIYGTPYHTGKEEDWEAVLAGEVDAVTIGSHEWFDCNGLIFDCKHFVSGSIIPHGRHTAISRDKLWNELWAARGGQPASDVFLRSHVHYFNYCGEAGKLMMILPSLQVWSKYGAKRHAGIINTGIVSFDVEDKEHYSWQPHLMDMTAFAPEATKI
jgi:hypothetical protein